MARASGGDLPEGISSPDDVVIALMGVTGAGKSTFIKRITEREDIQIGHDLTSETLECRAYQFEASGVNFALVDTPGFNDTYLDDAAILAQLASFMEASYRSQLKFTAILYLHPIINDRLEGSALDNLSMFRKLCGKKFYPNVVLATTFWSHVDEATGARREKELKETDEFWGSMCSRGSEVIRLPDDREGSVNLLLRLAKKNKTSLQVQEELVDQGLPISKTSAGAMSKNVGALEALREEFNKKMEDLAVQRKAELAAQKAEFAHAKLQKLNQELERTETQHQALMEQAEEKRRKALEEQEELLRHTRLETEKMKAELEKLSIKDKEDHEMRERVHKEQVFQAQVEAMNTRLTAQIGLLDTAYAAGTITAEVRTEFFEHNDLGRFCNFCLHTCSAKLSYSCIVCEDFDVCSNCFDQGERCYNKAHTTFARRSLIGTPAGKCRRAQYPIWTRFRIPCDNCGKMLQSRSSFIHCCSCNSDNYDLCLDCVIKGVTCLNSSHPLQLFMA